MPITEGEVAVNEVELRAVVARAAHWRKVCCDDGLHRNGRGSA